MAIEYPEIYKYVATNFFNAKVRIVVSEEINAPINKYIDQETVK